MDTSTLTTKHATDRAWHMLTRLHGRKLLLASDAAKKDASWVRGSGVVVIPDATDEEKLGAVAQLLWNTDPSGRQGDEAFELIAKAAAKAGYPVRR